MAATAVTLIATGSQVISAAHDIDEGTGRHFGSALLRIWPETRDRKLTLTADDLVIMVKLMKELKELVKKSRTKENQRLYRDFSSKIEKYQAHLESLMDKSSLDSWKNALRFDDARGANIKDLRIKVLEAKDKLISASRKIDFEMMKNASCLSLTITETRTTTTASSTGGQSNEVAAATFTGPAIQRNSLKVTFQSDVIEMSNLQLSAGDPLGVTISPAPSFLPPQAGCQ